MVPRLRILMRERRLPYHPFQGLRNNGIISPMSESPDDHPATPDTRTVVIGDGDVEKAREQLIEKITGRKNSKYARFVAAAALGSIPWIGGVISAAISLQAEGSQSQLDELQKLWLKEHEEKIRKLGATLGQLLERLDSLGDDIEERIRSEEYLSLVRKAFRSWDRAETQEKRELIRKLLANAGGTKLSDDDIVRLFIDWIDQYHEAHFKVIREIYSEPGVTRGRIWESIHGEQPREDSAEADLFKLLIRDLSTGSVIRQDRPTNSYGQFIAKKKKNPGRGHAPSVLKSAFDDVEPYVLTELGQQFVHYTMDELVPRIA